MSTMLRHSSLYRQVFTCCDIRVPLNDKGNKLSQRLSPRGHRMSAIDLPVSGSKDVPDRVSLDGIAGNLFALRIGIWFRGLLVVRRHPDRVCLRKTFRNADYLAWDPI